MGSPMERLARMEVEYEERQKGRKSRGASYGHVKRRILANEPLTGKTLELALDLVTPETQREGDKLTEFCNGIAKKLQTGHPLDDYERHMMVDVFLLHARLAG
jgi:hypothetical protein